MWSALSVQCTREPGGGSLGSGAKGSGAKGSGAKVLAPAALPPMLEDAAAATVLALAGLPSNRTRPKV